MLNFYNFKKKKKKKKKSCTPYLPPNSNKNIQQHKYGGGHQALCGRLAALFSLPSGHFRPLLTHPNTIYPS
jgi:hypothetical protein